MNSSHFVARNHALKLCQPRRDKSQKMKYPQIAAKANSMMPSGRGPRISFPMPKSALYIMAHPASQSTADHKRLSEEFGAMPVAFATADQPGPAGRTLL